MKNKTAKTKEKRAAEFVQPPSGTTMQADVLPEEAFLADAEKEPKRILLADHTRTIRTLRDKKRLTFRAIAEWFGERGLETDQSAVYRAYCASFPNVDDYGRPVEDEDPERDTIDEFENAKLKNGKEGGAR
ncbi:MAG TPA: hypothetical protein VNX46_01000 [Candidatus Acidoferrum sp.]|jgi:hypothetical protein|nr:hypothetical protein [Candidatus Acidoferrum sp.]